MADPYGMQVDEVERLGRGIASEGRRVDELCQQLSHLTSALPSAWHGADATAFVSSWRDQHGPHLLFLARELDAFGRVALQNAAQQRSASG